MSQIGFIGHNDLFTEKLCRNDRCCLIARTIGPLHLSGFKKVKIPVSAPLSLAQIDALPLMRPRQAYASPLATTLWVT
jgi:hypothetical protein